MSNTFYPGTRVIVFDSLLFKDDKKTPLSVTMKPATVVMWYGIRSEYFGWTDGNLIDVQFDHRERVSNGHFADHVKRIENVCNSKQNKF